MTLPDLSDSLTGAQALLGWKLVHQTAEGLTSGYIVETEAYYENDQASHSFGGERVRNAAMFRAAGTIYVYFTYGMHYCLNVVTGNEGNGQAVLIRALEPADGLEIMKRRRNVDSEINLTNGPAKLVQALAIPKSYGGTNLYDGPLCLEPGLKPDAIVQTTRVGISQAAHEPWRFYVHRNRFVSRL